MQHGAGGHYACCLEPTAEFNGKRAKKQDVLCTGTWYIYERTQSTFVPGAALCFCFAPPSPPPPAERLAAFQIHTMYVDLRFLVAKPSKDELCVSSGGVWRRLLATTTSATAHLEHASRILL